MIDRAVAGIVDWLAVQEWERSQFVLTLVDHPGSPWLTVDAERLYPYAEQIPKLSFAVWRVTGAVHLCEEGEVQDPALFSVEP